MNQTEQQASPAQPDHLALCPYCGGPAQEDFIVDISYIIECYWCGARTGCQDSEVAAIEAWNRRAVTLVAAPAVALKDEDYAAIVKRYEDAGDVQNADVIRKQWRVALRGEALGLGQDQGDAGNPVSVQVQRETAGDAGAAQTCRSKGDARPAAPASDQIAWAHELQMRVMLVDDDGDDDLHNLLGEVACCLAALTGRPGAPAVAAPADQLAFELPTGARVIRDVAGADLPANHPEVLQQGELVREALSAVSWLYRRLPHGYGRQQHIEVVIERLARETGTNIADLAERGPDPQSKNETEGKEPRA